MRVCARARAHTLPPEKIKIELSVCGAGGQIFVWLEIIYLLTVTLLLPLGKVTKYPCGSQRRLSGLLFPTHFLAISTAWLLKTGGFWKSR